MIRKILMSVTVFVGLVAIGELASRAIWSVADLSLSAENAPSAIPSAADQAMEIAISASV